MTFSQITIIFSFLLLSNDLIGQSEWVKFSPDDSLSFEVLVPEEMGIVTKEIKTTVGLLNSTTYAHVGADNALNHLYLINVVTYPTLSFPTDSLDLIDSFLLESIKSSSEAMGGEVVYSSDIDEQKNGIGKIFRIKYNDGEAVTKGKAFVKNDVFIMLQVFTLKANSLNDEIDDFLNSFKVKF